MAASSLAGSSGQPSSGRVGDEHRHAAREDDARDVRHVGRLVEDDLVTGVDDRREGHGQRLRGADRDQDLAVRVVAHAVQPLEVAGQRAAQLDGAEVAGVVGPTRRAATGRPPR